MNEANELIDAAKNASNITSANISELDDELELDDNSGVGYYDPPVLLCSMPNRLY